MRTVKHPILLFFFFLSLYGFIEIISYDRFTTSSIPNILFVALLLLMVMFEPKKSIFLLFPAIFFANDVSRFSAQTSLDLHSIWNVKVFGFTFPYFLTLFLIYPIIVYYLKKDEDTKITTMDRIIFLLLLTYGTVMLSGVFNIFSNFKMFLSDIAPFMAIGTIYIFIRAFFRDEKSVRTLVILLIYCIAIDVLLNVFFFLIGYGTHFGTTFRTTSDSGRIFYTLGIFIPAGIFFLKKRKTTIESILLLLFMFGSLFLIISWAGRMSWILSIVGAGIFLYLLPRKLRKPMVLWIIFTLLLIFMILSMTGATRTLITRMTTLTIWSPYQATGETSTAVRIVEVINAWHTVWTRKRILWGVGAGGYFTDKFFRFPFPLTLADYKLEWIQQRTFFHTHIPIFNVFFKGGLIAFVLYLMFAFKIFSFTINSYRHIKSDWWKGVLIGFVSFYPLLLTHNWTTKQNMLIGIILGVLANLESVNRSKNSSINTSLPNKTKRE